MPKTILVFCPNWVGDIVMATPAFAQLRKFYKDAYIIAVVRPPLQVIVQDSPWFDEYIGGQDKTWQGFWGLVKQLRTFKADLAVVFPNSLRAAALARFCGAKKIVGYKRNHRSWLLTQRIEPPKKNGKIVPVAMKAYYLELVKSLGVPVDFCMKPALHYSDVLKQKAAAILAKHNVTTQDTLVGFVPGSSYGPSKRWEAAKFGKLANMLQDRYRCKIIMFTSPNEAKIAHTVLANTHATIIDACKEKVGLDLLKPMIERCDVLVTNDTGPRHYGVALKVPQVITILGSSPLAISDDLETTTVVKVSSLACAPCRARACRYGHNKCMADITPEMVFNAIKL